MTLEEARKQAQEAMETRKTPVAIVKIGQAYENFKAGDYAIRCFIKGQRVNIGTIITTLGSYGNFYDTVVEIIDSPNLKPEI